MHHRLRFILSALLVSLALGGYAADLAVTNSAAGGGIVSNRVERIGVEQAFRKALGSIKGRVNLLDRNAHFRVFRMDAKSWHIQLEPKSDVPAGGLLIIVKDNGVVDLRLLQTNTDAGAWLASTKPAEPDLDVKARRGAAFRQGLQALAKWYKMTPDSFLEVRGSITLSGMHEDEWFMSVFGYSGTPPGGWWIDIKDNGTVNISSSL